MPPRTLPAKSASLKLDNDQLERAVALRVAEKRRQAESRGEAWHADRERGFSTTVRDAVFYGPDGHDEARSILRRHGELESDEPDSRDRLAAKEQLVIYRYAAKRAECLAPVDCVGDIPPEVWNHKPRPHSDEARALGYCVAPIDDDLDRAKCVENYGFLVYVGPDGDGPGISRPRYAKPRRSYKPI